MDYSTTATRTRKDRRSNTSSRRSTVRLILFFIVIAPLLAFPFFIYPHVIIDLDGDHLENSLSKWLRKGSAAAEEASLVAIASSTETSAYYFSTPVPKASTNIKGNSTLLVVSYSLYGDKEVYTTGMINAAKRLRTVFPGWQTRIYHDSKVPRQVLSQLTDIGRQVKLINVESDLPRWVHEELNPMAWRFLVASDSLVKAYIIRDGDSRPSFRDKAAVDEWLQSGRAFHIIRDHPMHNPTSFAPILGGMWGGLNRAVPHMDQLLRQHYGGEGQRIRYAEDQNFLWQNIMPLAYNDCLQHDSYYCRESNAIALPVPREDGESPNEYVGNDHALPDKFVADYRLNMAEYNEKYKACLEDRRKLEAELGKDFAVMVNTTFIGRVTGSSTEVWAEFNRKRKKAQDTKQKGKLKQNKEGGFVMKLKVS